MGLIQGTCLLLRLLQVPVVRAWLHVWIILPCQLAAAKISWSWTEYIHVVILRIGSDTAPFSDPNPWQSGRSGRTAMGTCDGGQRSAPRPSESKPPGGPSDRGAFRPRPRDAYALPAQRHRMLGAPARTPQWTSRQLPVGGPSRA